MAYSVLRPGRLPWLTKRNLDSSILYLRPSPAIPWITHRHRFAVNIVRCPEGKTGTVSKVPVDIAGPLSVSFKEPLAERQHLFLCRNPWCWTSRGTFPYVT